MNFRNPLRIDFEIRKLLFRDDYFTAAILELPQQLLQIDPFAKRSLGFKVFAATVVELTGPANIPISKMVEAHRDLN